MLQLIVYSVKKINDRSDGSVFTFCFSENYLNIVELLELMF